MQNNFNDTDQETCEDLHTRAEFQLESVRQWLEDFLQTHYEKKFVLSYRIKSVEKMMIKIQYETYEPQRLPDVIGFRVAVDTEDDVTEISNLIEKELTPIRKVDHFKEPTPSGFKANLYYFSLNDDIDINIEIQVMTKEMALWTDLTHGAYNSSKYGI